VSKTRQIPLPRIFAEGAAIVVSILLAFWIDAWWDDRQESENEKVLLAALAEEFREKLETLTVRRSFNEEILSSTTALIRASVETDYSLTAAEVDEHLAKLWWYNVEHEWETAVLDAVIAGGDLTAISNPTLRMNLAKWPVAFRVIRRRVGRDEEYFKNVLMPYLSRAAYLPQVYLIETPMPGDAEVDVSPPGWVVTQPFDNSHLLSDQQFVNILVEKVDRHKTILDLAFLGLDTKLGETLRMLDEELAD
jgi:hypothetical protein